MVCVFEKWRQPLIETETNGENAETQKNLADSIKAADCRFAKRTLAVLAGLIFLVGCSDAGFFPLCCPISLVTFCLRYLPVFRLKTNHFTIQGGCNYGNDG